MSSGGGARSVVVTGRVLSLDPFLGLLIKFQVGGMHPLAAHLVPAFSLAPFATQLVDADAAEDLLQLIRLDVTATVVRQQDVLDDRQREPTDVVLADALRLDRRPIG